MWQDLVQTIENTEFGRNHIANSLRKSPHQLKTRNGWAKHETLPCARYFLSPSDECTVRVLVLLRWLRCLYSYVRRNHVTMIAYVSKNECIFVTHVLPVSSASTTSQKSSLELSPPLTRCWTDTWNRIHWNVSSKRLGAEMGRSSYAQSNW